MENKIHFDLVSPEEKLISTDIAMATIPGEAGEFGVGAGHTSIVSSLRAGVISIHKEKGAGPSQYFIAGGFADVTGTNCTILAEEATPLKELDQATLEKDLETLSGDLDLAKEDADKRRLEREIALVKAKLTAVTGTLVI